MNKASLIEAISERVRLNKKAVESVLDTFEFVTIQCLQAGESVNLTGFGKFLPRVRTARAAADPQNPTQKIQVPTVVVPKFKAGKTLKDALKQAKLAKPQAE
ncbi:MAG: HU family DNA-binding protein [Patescibacteria group bacterium]|jgi:DNA-binding protein HU-beta